MMRKTQQVKLISKMPYRLRRPLTSEFLPKIWPGFLHTEYYNNSLQPRRMPDHITGFPLESFEGSVEQGHALIFGEMIAGGYVHPFHSMKALAESKDIPPTWLESVHRFDWLRDLQAVNTAQANKIASRLIDEWLYLYKKYHPLAWRVDICSSRLLNMYSSWKYVNEHTSTSFRLRMRSSLCRQATFIERRLHTVHDEDKIHALCAILWSSIHLPDWRARYKPAMTILFSELNKQILSDGGHISRSPSRTFKIFHDLVNLSLNLSYNHIPVPTVLDGIIQEQATFIRSMRHGDKRFGLFHGGCLGDASLIDAILVRSHTEVHTHNLILDSGYARMQCGSAIVIMDTGKKIAKTFKDQEHASPMSFEFSHGAQRIITNAGAELDIVRPENKHRHAAFRSSAAHSMATIGRKNSQITHDFEKPPVFHSQDIGQKVMAAHEGWKHLGWLHQRSLALSSLGNELLGQDLFVANDQKKQPRTDEPIYIRFLLAPGVIADKAGDDTEVTITLPDETQWLFNVDNGKVSIGQGIWQGEMNNEKAIESIIVTLPCNQQKIIVNWQLSCVEEHFYDDLIEDDFDVEETPTAPQNHHHEGDVRAGDIYEEEEYYPPQQPQAQQQQYYQAPQQQQAYYEEEEEYYPPQQPQAQQQQYYQAPQQQAYYKEEEEYYPPQQAQQQQYYQAPQQQAYYKEEEEYYLEVHHRQRLATDDFFDDEPDTDLYDEMFADDDR